MDSQCLGLQVGLRSGLKNSDYRSDVFMISATAHYNCMAAEREITGLELSRHRRDGDLWFAIEEKVYNVSDFSDHPGGLEALLEQAGKDATEAFINQGHGPKARNLLAKFLVGKLAAGTSIPREADVTVTRQKPKGFGNFCIYLLVFLTLLILIYRYAL